MYTRLTKTVKVDETECIACIHYGTEMCRIHNGTPDCGRCEVFAAILNQLNAFEDIFTELTEQTEE